MRRPSWAICLRLSTPRPSLRNRVAIYRRAEPQPLRHDLRILIVR